MSVRIPGGRPTPATLRFLVGLVADGGTSTEARLLVGSWSPIDAAIARGWAKTEPRGDGTGRAQERIITEGRIVAFACDPAGYTATLPAGQVMTHLDAVATVKRDHNVGDTSTWTFGHFGAAIQAFEKNLTPPAPVAPTVKERFDAAVADLAEENIIATLDRTSLTGGDAWTRADNNVAAPAVPAVAHVEGGFWTGGHLRRHTTHGVRPVPFLWFAFPHKKVTVGQAIAEAFRARGFRVDWNGDPTESVQVRLVEDTEPGPAQPAAGPKPPALDAVQLDEDDADADCDLGKVAATAIAEWVKRRDDGHVARIQGPDGCGHWGWHCELAGCTEDRSGYERADEVLGAALRHAPLAADSKIPDDAETE